MNPNRKPQIFLAVSSVVALASACAGSFDRHSNAQGWDDRQQTSWADATQGSRLMPLSWFRALAQPDSDRLFGANDYLVQFRAVPQDDGALPIGFAIDEGSDKNLTVSKLRWFSGQSDTAQWVGLNCAACHTAVIEYDGKQHRIDGGPSLFDYQTFVEQLDLALHQTLDSASSANPAGRMRFANFAQRVLCQTAKDDTQAETDMADTQTCNLDTSANRTMLRTALASLVQWEDRVEAMNLTSSRYGFGRVDAFGHIYNKVALFNQAQSPTPNPASAPVSFPFLWDIYRHDFLQWNGIVPKVRISLGGGREFDFGAMGRNTGEVIGVFGDVAVTPNPGLTGYKSSVQVANLERIERMLTALKAPKWPSELGDPGDVSQGRKLFADHCQGCHTPQPGTGPYKVKLIPQRANDPNRTDGWMACNAIRYASATGNLAGMPESYIGSGPKYGAGPAPIASMLSTTVKGALIGQKGALLAQAGRVFLGVGGLPKVSTEEGMGPIDPILQACYDANNELMRYKARPLDGIWATAPYLHNGSVPNLYQLLLPPTQRVKEFHIGTRRFDATAVGYLSGPEAPGNGFRFDTMLRGNSNGGHDYGAGKLSDAERWALVAYLKTL